MMFKCLELAAGQRYLALDIGVIGGGTGLLVKTKSLVKFDRHTDH